MRFLESFANIFWLILCILAGAAVRLIPAFLRGKQFHEAESKEVAASEEREELRKKLFDDPQGEGRSQRSLE